MLNVLRALGVPGDGRGSPPLNISALAARCGLPISTTWRIVNILVEEGWAAALPGVTGHTRSVLAGGALLATGAGAARDLDHVVPALAELAARTGQTAALMALASPTHRVCLHVSSPEDMASAEHGPVLGRLYPLDQGADGLVLLASLPPRRQADAMARLRVADPQRLRAALQRVDATGHATSRNAYAGGATISVPVVARDTVVGALAVFVSASRVRRESPASFVIAAREAADRAAALLTHAI